jgi:hypothetical protein
MWAPLLQVPRLALKTPFRDGTIQDVAKQVLSCCHLRAAAHVHSDTWSLLHADLVCATLLDSQVADACCGRLAALGAGAVAQGAAGAWQQ